MSDQDKHVKQMSAVRMPTDSIDFLRKNPKIEAIAGKLMCALIEASDLLNHLKSFYTVENFQAGQESGTPEELKKFVDDSLKALTDAQTFRDLPPGAFEAIREKLGKSALATEIHVVNGPSKEAEA